MLLTAELSLQAPRNFSKNFSIFTLRQAYFSVSGDREQLALTEEQGLDMLLHLHDHLDTLMLTTSIKKALKLIFFLYFMKGEDINSFAFLFMFFPQQLILKLMFIIPNFPARLITNPR